MTNRKEICRLCLKKCDNFKPIIRKVRDYLENILVLKINLVATKRPVMCSDCEEMLLKCVDFKANCNNTYDNYIAPFIDSKCSAKLDLIEVYLSKKEDVSGLQEDHDICMFCVGPVKSCSAVTLDVGEGNFMLTKCLPELDLSIIKKPVICAACHCSLENCFSFITNCLYVEEKIKKYCDAVGKNRKRLVDLSSLVQFTTRDISSLAGCNTVDAVKAEKQYKAESPKKEAEHTYEKLKETQEERFKGLNQSPTKDFVIDEIGSKSQLIKLEQKFWEGGESSKDIVKHEGKSLMEMGDQKFKDDEQFSLKTNILTCEEGIVDMVKSEEKFYEQVKIECKNEDLVDQKFIHTEEIEIKTDEHDFYRSQNCDVSPQPEMVANLMANKVDKKPELYTTHVSRFIGSSKLTMYKCTFCLYEAKYKQEIRKHLQVHKVSEVIYKCELCPFQSKYKSNLKKHSLVHKKTSELTMYHCENCSHQTKYKHSITKHALLHTKEALERVNQCETCSFQTIHNGVPEKHKSTHKVLLANTNLSPLTVHNCELCAFRTTVKYRLESHMLSRKHQSDVSMYYCESCGYQTKKKNHLVIHSLVHKDASKVTMYSCELCVFQTKYKCSLRKHTLTHEKHEPKHRNPSEIPVYKCTSCLFQTNHRYSLKNHLLRHCDLLEAMMYQCQHCSFETKDKWYLAKHLLNHKIVPGKTTHRCGSCSFQTKYKRALAAHNWIHIDPSKMTKFQCGICPFQSRLKVHLKRHLEAHRNSRITVHECESCSFKTNYKSTFQKHALTHKKSTK